MNNHNEQGPPPAVQSADDRFTRVPVLAPKSESPDVIVIRKRVFVGLILLFAIPVLGWVACTIVAATAKNRNIRNFARAMLIVLAVTIVLTALAYLIVDNFIIDLKWAWSHITDLAKNLDNYY